MVNSILPYSYHVQSIYWQWGSNDNANIPQIWGETDSLYLLMSNLHFAKFTPYTGQVIYFTVIHFGSFIKYHPCLRKLAMLFIKLSKLYPQCVRFAWCQLWINSLHCFSVCVDDLFGLPLIKFDPFMPFMNIVGILAQKDTAKLRDNSRIKEVK